MIYPCITLYQPWATWIMRGWKTIETRTHNKFACLNGKRIGIHAGMTTDASAINNTYLTKYQLLQNPEDMINGYLIGAATVIEVRELTNSDSKAALIDCHFTKRYGLFLDNIQGFREPVFVKGEIGIWYFDVDKGEKVRKPKETKLQLF